MFKKGDLKFDDETLAQMRALWEGSPELSAKAIGERFGVSKMVVIGQAQRRQWKPRRESPGAEPKSKIFTRLDALHARMDAVLAATRPHVEERKPLMVRAWADDDPRRLKQSARLRALGGNLRQRGAE